MRSFFSKQPSRILWVDCLGGLVVGLLVLFGREQICEWENLPLSIVVGMGAANLLYGSFSLYVTLQQRRPRRLVEMLAVANIAWLLVCLAIVLKHSSEMSLVGFVHVIGEGVYVAALGIMEWSWRTELSQESKQQTG